MVSMLLDHAIMCFIAGVFMAPSLLYELFHLPGATDPTSLSIIHYNAYEIFAFSLYFNKDIYLGQSPAKRILKFQVFDIRTNRPASPLQCLIRNFTVLIWPVEVVVAFINNERRLGDYLAGTKLGLYEPRPATRPNWGLMIVAILLGMLYTYLTMVCAMSYLFRFMGSIGRG